MTNIPAFVSKIVAQSDCCTVPLNGYGESLKTSVFSRGPTLAPSSTVDIVGKGSEIYVAEDSFAHISVSIKGHGSAIVIGAGCRLRRLTVSIQGDSCAVIFGAGTTCESAAIIVAPDGQHVVFGDDCMLSSGVLVRTDDGHPVFDRSSRERIGLPASVRIGAHVWLGNGSRINKGAIIGRGTIIGQCSIAGGELDAFSIYAGAPARKIRDNINWSRTGSFDDIPASFR